MLDEYNARPALYERAGAVLARRAAVRASRCITVEDKISSLDGRVAGKAGVVHRLTGGFAIVKMGEPPAASRGVFY